MSTPTIAPTACDQAPAQQTTMPVATSPDGRPHRADHAVVDLDAGHLAARGDRGAVGARARRVAERDRLRCSVPVERAERRRDDAVEPRQRGQRGGLLERDEAAGDAELVLQRDGALERVDVLLAVEQEQVTDAVQVDLGSWAAPRTARMPPGFAGPTAMLSGSENCARTPPAALLVEPEASSARSTSSVSTPASARWKAALVPITPPPTTTTSAFVRHAHQRRTALRRKKPRLAGRSARRRIR